MICDNYVTVHDFPTVIDGRKANSPFRIEFFAFYKPIGHKLAGLRALRLSRRADGQSKALQKTEQHRLWFWDPLGIGKVALQKAYRQGLFVSRDDRAKEEALCRQYRNIGIQAVAAAKCLRPKAAPTAGTDRAVTANSADRQS